MRRLEMGTPKMTPRHLQTLCDLLAQHVPHAEVWAYGSRVTGGSHEGSDLDLVVRQPADAAQAGAALAAIDRLREALQASDLPMLVEVHDWSQLPVAFRSEIEERHVILQPAQRTLSAPA
jgi:predicted nucleotidyltransferase